MRLGEHGLAMNTLETWILLLSNTRKLVLQTTTKKTPPDNSSFQTKMHNHVSVHYSSRIKSNIRIQPMGKEKIDKVYLFFSAKHAQHTS